VQILRFQTLFPGTQLLRTVHQPGGMSGICLMIIGQRTSRCASTHSCRLLRPQVVEKRNGAAIAAIKEKMQKIRMSRWPPATCRDHMHQWQTQSVAIELYRFTQTPRRASSMVHTE